MFALPHDNNWAVEWTWKLETLDCLIQQMKVGQIALAESVPYHLLPPKDSSDI